MKQKDKRKGEIKRAAEMSFQKDLCKAFSEQIANHEAKCLCLGQFCHISTDLGDQMHHISNSSFKRSTGYFYTITTY